MIQGKRIAIVQSNYIPWKGYFDLIRAADLFIVHDDIQYTKESWRNRNLIKTQNGLIWLTIPVESKAKFGQTIEETRIARLPGKPSWARSHWARIEQCYRAAPYFRTFGPLVKALLLSQAEEPMLSASNVAILRGLCSMIGINTPLVFSRDYGVEGRRGDRVLALCKAAGATHYLSGPAAKFYIDIEMFRNEGVEVVFADYAGYPEYPQLHGPFEHGVAILDLLFNMGPGALSCMKDVAHWPEGAPDPCGD